MGRPREHDERTAAALLAAAERRLGQHGPAALSVRGVAGDVGTTTRAVYSLFGSKDGLIAALGAHAYDLLREGLEALPITDDPAADLVDAGLMFRRFATEHPSLFAIGVQRIGAGSTLSPTIRAAADPALDVLKARVARLVDPTGPGGPAVFEAAVEFHALCEGLAAVERRGIPGASAWERIWRQGLGALVAGLAAQPATAPHSS